MKKKEQKKEGNKTVKEIIDVIKSLFSEARANRVVVKDNQRVIFELSFLAIIIITIFLPIISLLMAIFVAMKEYKVVIEKK